MNICILLSSYNGEKYICEQIDSILNQEDVDIHLLIRDDGSTDSTIDFINKYKDKHANIIEVIRGKNLGYARSFSELIKYAYYKYPECKYFAFADQDDVWLKDKLSSAIKKLDKESALLPVTYCSNKLLVDEKLNPIRKSWTSKEVKLSKERCMIQSFATGCTMVFNRVAAEMYINHIPAKLKVHDYLMYQQCMFLGRVIYDSNPYILYRQHGSNQIGAPNFFNRMKRRFGGHYKEHALEKQNYYFLQSYKDLLTVEDIGLLTSFVFYRKNLFTKLSLLFNKKIKYTNFESNFFYIIKILLGTV